MTTRFGTTGRQRTGYLGNRVGRGRRIREARIDVFVVIIARFHADMRGRDARGREAAGKRVRVRWRAVGKGMHGKWSIADILWSW